MHRNLIYRQRSPRRGIEYRSRTATDRDPAGAATQQRIGLWWIRVRPAGAAINVDRPVALVANRAVLSRGGGRIGARSGGVGRRINV